MTTAPAFWRRSEVTAAPTIIVHRPETNNTLRAAILLSLPLWLRQPDKTLFAVRCKSLDRQDDFIAF
jgi:hypothetical protein